MRAFLARLLAIVTALVALSLAAAPTRGHTVNTWEYCGHGTYETVETDGRWREVWYKSSTDSAGFHWHYYRHLRREWDYRIGEWRWVFKYYFNKGCPQ